MSNFKDMVRLAKDVETFTTKNGKSGAKLVLAIPRPYRKDAPQGAPTADFVTAVAYSGTAEFINRNLRKGARVLVEGNLRVDQYEKDGVRRYSTYVLINEVVPIDFNKSNGDAAPAQASSAPADDGWGSSDIPF